MGSSPTEGFCFGQAGTDPGLRTPRAWLTARLKQRVEPSLDRLLLDLRASRGDRVPRSPTACTLTVI